MELRKINPWRWQDSLGFSQAIEVTGGSRTLYCAGQASVGEDGGALHPGDMRAQLTQAMDNLEAVLTRAGYTLADVVRLNYYTTDIDAFFNAYDAATSRLTGANGQPASTLLGISGLALPGLLVEIEATAVK